MIVTRLIPIAAIILRATPLLLAQYDSTFTKSTKHPLEIRSGKSEREFPKDTGESPVAKWLFFEATFSL